MSGTEYGFSLCNHPPERFSIRPSGFNEFGFWPAVLFSATGSYFSILLGSFDFGFGQLRFLLLFFKISFSLSKLWISMVSPLSLLQILTI